MKIIFLYAALLAILFFLLSIQTIRLRRSFKIAVGDAGNPKMLRVIRVHSNFSEYVPLSLMLIYFVEASGGHPYLIHALGLSLLMARLSHAYGLSHEKENFRFRVSGMATNFTVILLCASWLLFSYVFGSVK